MTSIFGLMRGYFPADVRPFLRGRINAALNETLIRGTACIDDRNVVVNVHHMVDGVDEFIFILLVNRTCLVGELCLTKSFQEF